METLQTFRIIVHAATTKSYLLILCQCGYHPQYKHDELEKGMGLMEQNLTLDFSCLVRKLFQERHSSAIDNNVVLKYVCDCSKNAMILFA
jgi:hypothetical protein